MRYYNNCRNTIVLLTVLTFVVSLVSDAKGQCCEDDGGSVGGCCRSSDPYVLPLPSTADQVNKPVFYVSFQSSLLRSIEIASSKKRRALLSRRN